MSTKLRSHGKSMVVWVLLAMLILGLGGFGVTSFTGRINSVGTVGETPIPVNDYARALRDEFSAAAATLGRPLSMQEARAAGVDVQVLGRLIGQAALSEEARRLGLSVGDGELHRQITSADAFKGVGGSFDRTAYSMMLQQQGYTEASFERSLRDDLTRSILQSAVTGGVRAPDAVVSAYTAYLTESRAFAWAEITEADLPEGIPAPSEEELRGWWSDHPDEFTSPETRKITYAWLAPEMLLDQVKLDDAAIQAAYDANIDQYVQPERRLVERLVYPSLEEAQAARARLDAGASFGELAGERGLTLADADMGDVTEAQLGAAGPAVFALEAPGVAGPLETDLGPALFSVNAVIAAQTTTLEEARDELAGEVEMDRARRLIADQSNDLEDRLAGGATLEDMAAETAMELGSIDFTADSDQGIAGYESFREAARAVSTEDFPELANLDDGGVFALRLDAIEPPAVIPFDDIREQVEASWRAAQVARAAQARAEAIVAEVNDGGSLATQGVVVTQVPRLARGGFLPDLPRDAVTRAFDTAPGQAASIMVGGRAFVVQVAEVIPADPDSEDSAIIAAQIDSQLSQSLANDMLGLYATAIQSEAGLSLDQAAINAVQAQMQ